MPMLAVLSLAAYLPRAPHLLAPRPRPPAHGAGSPLAVRTASSSFSVAHISMMAPDDDSSRGAAWSHEDDEALHASIAQSATRARLGKPLSVLEGLQSVNVLIFNAGQKDEGVYTLQGRTARAAAYVLAFENTEDAACFAQLLQAEGFDLATPLCWDREQLVAFCDAGTFEVSLVPCGALITPPSKNEYDRDAFEKLQQEGTGSAAATDGSGETTEGPPRDRSVEFGSYPSERAAFERMFMLDETDGDAERP